MSPNFENELEAIESYLRGLMSREVICPRPELERFWESLSYSLFSGGKRFRPLLSLLTAKAVGASSETVLPMAASIELIHTYSLIHDDLPSLDNDDIRRGRPTHHKVYGEAPALLAGDGLLTLAFQVLARSRSSRALEAVALLAEAAGVCGMVGGQVLDIAVKQPNLDLLNEIHLRKTGALIQVAVEGAAVLCDVTEKRRTDLRAYAGALGLAFQLADDLQDADGFMTALGEEPTRQKLKEASAAASRHLAAFGPAGDGLREMVRLNLERV